MVPLSSLAKGWCRMLGTVDKLITRSISPMRHVFLVSWQFLGGSDQGSGRRYALDQGPVPNSFTVLLRPFQSLAASATSSLFFVTVGPTDSRRGWMWYPHRAHRV